MRKKQMSTSAVNEMRRMFEKAIEERNRRQLGGFAGIAGIKSLSAGQFPIYDAKAVCAKCEHDEIDTEYKAASNSYDSTSLSRDEHIERRCERCGYRWGERSLDAATPVELLAREG